MINEDIYDPKEYLNELILQELEIVSGVVPIEIFTMGIKEGWLLNFKLGKFIRRKLFKRAMYLIINTPKALRKPNGSSKAQVRQYDGNTRYVSKTRIIDSGTANLNWRINPFSTGFFAPGTVYDIYDFQGMKTLKPKDKFRLRVQEVDHGKEVKEDIVFDAEIERYRGK